MRCKECGARLEESQSRCPYCGTRNLATKQKPIWKKRRNREQEETTLFGEVSQEREDTIATEALEQGKLSTEALNKDERTWLNRHLIKCVLNSLIAASIFGIVAAIAGMVLMQGKSIRNTVGQDEVFAQIQQLYQQGAERELGKLINDHCGDDWDSPFYDVSKIYEFHQGLDGERMDFMNKKIQYEDYMAKGLLWHLQLVLHDAEIYYNDSEIPIVGTMYRDYQQEAEMFATMILGFDQEQMSLLQEGNLPSDEEEMLIQTILDRRLQYEQGNP